MSARDPDLCEACGCIEENGRCPWCDAPSSAEVVADIKAEIDRLRAEVARLTPVVEAAKAWRECDRNDGDLDDAELELIFSAVNDLVAAVDALATSDQPVTRPECSGVSSTEQHRTPTKPDPQFLGGETAVLTDTRDMAMVIVVDLNGVADAKVNGIGYRQAAEWVRHIAGLWEARADAEDAALAGECVGCGMPKRRCACKAIDGQRGWAT